MPKNNNRKTIKRKSLFNLITNYVQGFAERKDATQGDLSTKKNLDSASLEEASSSNSQSSLSKDGIGGRNNMHKTNAQPVVHTVLPVSGDSVLTPVLAVLITHPLTKGRYLLFEADKPESCSPFKELNVLIQKNRETKNITAIRLSPVHSPLLGVPGFIILSEPVDNIIALLERMLIPANDADSTLRGNQLEDEAVNNREEADYIVDQTNSDKFAFLASADFSLSDGLVLCWYE